MKKTMFILLGASGAGKTTGGIYLKEKLGVPECISDTTRKMRDGEIDGYSYYFKNRLQFFFTRKIEKSNYAGNYYCLSKKEVERKFKENDKVFLIADIHGVEQIKNYYKNNPNVDVVVIYFDTTLEVMEERMRARGDSEENIRKRLDKAIRDKELENGKYADYVLPANITLEEMYRQLESIVTK